MTNMTDRFMKYYMDVALRTAQMSHAVRLKVGSVLVMNNGIIATGYNGMPAGMDNCCEHEVDGRLTTKPEVIHSEQNTLYRAVERRIIVSDGTMFISHAPCINCAMAMRVGGVRTVCYAHDYRDKNGVDYLREAGIEVIGGDGYNF